MKFTSVQVTLFFFLVCSNLKHIVSSDDEDGNNWILSDKLNSLMNPFQVFARIAKCITELKSDGGNDDDDDDANGDDENTSPLILKNCSYSDSDFVGLISVISNATRSLSSCLQPEADKIECANQFPIQTDMSNSINTFPTDECDNPLHDIETAILTITLQVKYFISSGLIGESDKMLDKIGELEEAMESLHKKILKIKSDHNGTCQVFWDKYKIELQQFESIFHLLMGKFENQSKSIQEDILQKMIHSLESGSILEATESFHLLRGNSTASEIALKLAVKTVYRAGFRNQRIFENIICFSNKIPFYQRKVVFKVLAKMATFGSIIDPNIILLSMKWKENPEGEGEDNKHISKYIEAGVNEILEKWAGFIRSGTTSSELSYYPYRSDMSSKAMLEELGNFIRLTLHPNGTYTTERSVFVNLFYFISELPLETEHQEVALFELIDTAKKSHDYQTLLKVAYYLYSEIKLVEKKDGSRALPERYKRVSNCIPRSIRMFIWHDYCYLHNIKYMDYLTVSKDLQILGYQRNQHLNSLYWKISLPLVIGESEERLNSSPVQFRWKFSPLLGSLLSDTDLLFEVRHVPTNRFLFDNLGRVNERRGNVAAVLDHWKAFNEDSYRWQVHFPYVSFGNREPALVNLYSFMSNAYLYQVQDIDSYCNGYQCMLLWLPGTVEHDAYWEVECFQSGEEGP